MKNLRSARALTGYAVRASDGEVGKVSELYFDDAGWEVRYLVVDTARWLPGRKVLLPAAAVIGVRPDRGVVDVALTRDQVRRGPSRASDMPIALQRRASLRARHNWAIDLAGEALAAVPEAFATPAFDPINAGGRPFDPHLRTTRVVLGLRLRAGADEVGVVDDLIVDEDEWTVRYAVIRLGGGRRVLLLPQFLRDIRIEESVAVTDLPAHAVLECPVLDPATMLTCRYEAEVEDHYNGYRGGARPAEAERS
jgi:sporulation protein YlmC with PRC-barrel domain